MRHAPGQGAVEVKLVHGGIVVLFFLENGLVEAGDRGLLGVRNHSGVHGQKGETKVPAQC